ncbi:hypothetical protein E4U56_007175 [Claviceps arundinis]|uniref:Uncharacterized protein n=1 Tax=Claviceps arundinis TaxID=1623583 RepID=A0A9P7MLQ8_9HYPO|nr:hypothetical protein E4U56_007175 [Claviceps arundinis]
MTGNKRVRYTENVTQKTISTSPVEKMATPTAVDRPMKKKIRTKKRNPAGEGAAAPTRSIVIPTKVVKPGFTAKLTKRGKRLATPANVWAVSFTTTDDAMACVGKGIKFGVKDGCTSPVEVQLEKYLTSGPRIFICERQGPITNSEAQQMISSAEFLSCNKFWYGTYKRRGVEGAKRILVLETPPEVTTMGFSGPNGYELRFRPESRDGRCELCAWPTNQDHGTLKCQFLAGTVIPENMPMRLEEIPVNPQVWTCAFGSINDARACVGKKILFDSEEAVLERYLTSGPRTFIRR